MKLIHTSDWHIGKTLQKEELTEDLKIFFSWLIELIEKEHVEVLLISGDIFDQANPSADDRKMYYDFLRSLIQTKTKVVITGGNHDSARMLEVSGEILELLDIKVIGGARIPTSEEVIEIVDQKGKLQAVICAVPFLRDHDLRKAMGMESSEDRIEQIRRGINKHYKELSDLCIERYDHSIPVIAMGHLYAQGASLSDSEREIHIGNLASIESSLFSDRFNYVALGHIHKPQKVGKSDRIRYSGSPIPLSFSERNDQKQVIILDFKTDGLSVKEIPIPNQRLIKTITGTVQEIRQKLENFNNPYELPAFVELLALEKTQDHLKQIELEQLSDEFDSDSIRILKSRIQFENISGELSDLLVSGTHIDDLSPTAVFDTLMDDKNYSEDRVEILRVKFRELLQKLNS